MKNISKNVVLWIIIGLLLIVLFNLFQGLHVLVVRRDATARPVRADARGGQGRRASAAARRRARRARAAPHAKRVVPGSGEASPSPRKP